MFSEVSSQQNEESSSVSMQADNGTSIVMTELQHLLNDYRAKHPGLSLYRLSGLTGVSEPTLRRISSGDFRQVCQTKNLLGVLKLVFKKDSISELIACTSGFIKSHLEERFPQASLKEEISYREDLTEKLSEPLKYLVFKRIDTSHSGVSLSEIRRMFGDYGVLKCEELIDDQLIKSSDGVLKSSIASYCMSNECFVKNFKSVAGYIKATADIKGMPYLRPRFANYSAALNQKGFKKAQRLLKETNEKMGQILTEPEYKGSIPTFYLSAIDSLDTKLPHEF
ncbi:MAG: hypothetical protein HRT45_00210 [Bdellovibrionales bacterium]|nr:hypothetical protein [Bdellovibrionales bacterium]